MTVAELIEALQNMPPGWRVAIPISTLSVAIGAAPDSGVIGVFRGFDWEDGTVFLQSEQKLRDADAEYEASRSEHYHRGEALAFIWMSVKNTTLTDAQKMESIKRILRNRGFKSGVEEPEQKEEHT